MPCQLICPNLRCRKIVRAGDALRGKIVQCPNCRCMMRVPPPRAAQTQVPAVPTPIAPAPSPAAPSVHAVSADLRCA